jgi:hypothetical protein
MTRIRGRTETPLPHRRSQLSTEEELRADIEGGVMSHTKRRVFGVIAIAAAATGLAVTAGPSMATASKPKPAQVTHETFHIANLQSIDLGSGVSELVYAGDLSAQNQQGHFGGSCVLVSPTTYQCAFIGTYSNGQLVHEGLVDAAALTSPSPDFDLATTGGTGTYRGSRGEIHVHRAGSITDGEVVHHYA